MGQAQIRLPTLFLNPEDKSPEVQNKCISGPTKRTPIFFYFKKNQQAFSFRETLAYIGLHKVGKRWSFTDHSAYDYDPKGRNFNEDDNEMCAGLTSDEIVNVVCSHGYQYLCRSPTVLGRCYFFERLLFIYCKWGSVYVKYDYMNILRKSPSFQCFASYRYQIITSRMSSSFLPLHDTTPGVCSFCWNFKWTH